MFLLEHEAKTLLARFGMPVPHGVVIVDPAAPLPLSPPLAVKAQEPTGGRGKAGGVRLADSAAEARAHVTALLGSTLLGHHVQSVLVEERVPAEREGYLAIVLDRAARGPVLVASDAGGVDVETSGDALRLAIHPFLGVPSYAVRRVSTRLGVYPVRMDGAIAVATTGAGQLMATLDYVQALGGTLAGGLDLGGIVGHRPAELAEALGFVREFSPRAVLLNSYVRTWKNDVIAEALVKAIGDLHPGCPIVARLGGNRAAEGEAILGAAGIAVTRSLVEACRLVVDAVR